MRSGPSRKACANPARCAKVPAYPFGAACLFELLLLVFFVAGLVGYARLRERLNRAERRADDLEARLDTLADHLAARTAPAAPRADAVPVRAAIATPPPVAVSAPTDPVAEPAPPPAEPPAQEPAAEPPPARDLESLIAGKLPIWIGGAALVLAGFFLIRWGVETGLLGPAVRTILAALFSLALVALAEVARRHPLTRDDARIAQSLAGAAVASAYGTLYLAAAIYDLIGALSAFVLMLGVTAAALGLALRHGPPTAAMALIGGFLAPLVAGYDTAGIGPLLVYLALFVAALFGLAIRRGWAWLALAATFAAFAWINLLFALLGASDLPGLAAFTILVALGASLVLPATGERRPALVLLPLVAGLAQFLALAPGLDFSPLAWGFYLVLSAAALFLAARDTRLALAAPVAALVLLLLLATALLGEAVGTAPLAAIAATLLFGGAGHALAPRHKAFALTAVIGTAGPWLVALALRPALLSDALWLLSGLALAATCASLAWRSRTQAGTRDPGLLLGTAGAALLGVVALAVPLPLGWIGVPIAAAMAALALWASRTDDKDLARLPVLAFIAGIGFALPPLAQWAGAAAAAGSGDPLSYAQLPAPLDLLRLAALPAAVALALLARVPGSFASTARPVAAIVCALVLVTLHTLARQPLAIADLPRFEAYGWLERIAITHALLAAGWLLLRRGKLPKLGIALLALGAFRIAFLDLLVFNPMLVAQAVGALPLANLAVAHCALAAFWFWSLPGSHRPARLFAAAMTLAAALVLVRQIAQGSILTGPVTLTESFGYSAAALGVAIFWLWRGVSAGAKDLRQLGIALLTLVTIKVFALDAARLDGVLRVLSFLGLGLALIGIGALYGRFLRSGARPKDLSGDAPLRASPSTPHG